MPDIFAYDKQSFQDLEMLKERQESSVYAVFNNTLTAGGADFLKELIQYPLTDIAELQRRGKLIQFFIDHPTELAISSRQLKFIEKYININVTVLKSNPIDSLYHRFTEWLKPSNDYYLLKAGCENIIEVLAELDEKLRFQNPSKELLDNTKTIQELSRQLKADLKTGKKASWNRIVKLDRLFRIKFSGKLKSLLQEVYCLDAYLAIAKTARKHSFCLPEYEPSAKPVLFAKGLRHPLLENAVPNDIAIGYDENMCFLTGPNMAGKSTFLKAVGIAVFLAQLGFPVPASTFKTSLYSGIITSINLSDNLSFGYSHFYSEVNRVKEAAIALAEGRQMFVIFDELFRGTNVKDAFEASAEIIKGFAEIGNCTFFMSTHIVEIAQEIKQYPNIRFRYFDAELAENELKYSYQLKTGVSDQRLGMHIVKKEGILEMLKAIQRPVH